MMQEIDVIGNIAESNIRFMLNTALWDNFDSDVLRIVSSPRSWNEVKLLSPNGKRNPQLRTIPNNKGGIYLFLAKPNILPESHLYLMYIGRAFNTKTENLRKRCSKYPVEKKRPKIKRMIEQWGKYLYIRYLPLDDDNATIDFVESELINKILPPFNDKIPDKRISAAVKAFTM
jgi:excinuclease UvrABC nuclease subunit